MSILFSREGEYTVQALCYLALKPEDEMVSVRELTEDLGIPYFYLGKILQKLVRQGILNSRRGTNGGFSLAIPASKITLYDIHTAIEGDTLLTSCVLGFKECSEKTHCAVHHEWRIVREGLSSMLRSRDILTVARETRKKELDKAR